MYQITQSALKQLMETDPIHDGENEGRTEGDDGEVGMSRNVTGEQQAGHVVDEKSRGSSVDWQMLEVWFLSVCLSDIRMSVYAYVHLLGFYQPVKLLVCLSVD